MPVRIITKELKSGQLGLYLRILKSKDYDLSHNLKCTIDPNKWDSDNREIKYGKDLGLLKAKNDIDKLKKEIERQELYAHADGKLITKEWLEKVVYKFRNKDVEGLSPYVENWAQFCIDNHETITTPSGDTGVSISRKKSYQTSLDSLRKYRNNKKTLVADVNQEFYNDYIVWLRKVARHDRPNTVSKYAADILFFCRFAKEKGIVPHPDLFSIKRIRPKKQELKDNGKFLDTIVFTEFEWGKVMALDFSERPALDNVRKFMVLGLITTCRVEDLLKQDRSYIKDVFDEDGNKGKAFMAIHSKSNKIVPIPLMEGADMPYDMNDEFLKILGGDFPYKISKKVFRLHIKTISKLAKINEIHYGTMRQIIVINGKKEERDVEGNYPKYELLAPHALRRTGATWYNHNKSASFAKKMTTHAKEETLRLYVNDSEGKQYTELKKGFQKSGRIDSRTPVLEANAPMRKVNSDQ